MRVAICVVASYRVACMSSSGFATSGVGVGGGGGSVHMWYTQIRYMVCTLNIIHISLII